MGFLRDYNPEWADKIIRMIDELLDILSEYFYDDCSSKRDIIIKETEIYEYAEEVFPDLLSDLNGFFDYLHETIRNNMPIEEKEIEDYVLIIHQHINQSTELNQDYFANSDDFSKYDLEVTNKKSRERHNKERDYINRIINSDQIYCEDDIALPVSRAEQFALAREYRQNTVSIIITFLSNISTPTSIYLIHKNVPGATFQVIDILRKRPEIIDYKDKVMLGSKLEASSSTVEILKEAINETFILDKVHTCGELYRQLIKSQPDILHSLYIDNSFSLFSVIQYLFPNDFVYVRPKIGLPGQAITKPIENITNYIEGKYETSIEDLRNYIENADYDLTINLSLIKKLPDVIMLDRNHLAPKSRLNLSEDQLQQMISLIYEELKSSEDDNETLAIRDLTCITKFPKIDLQLNEWLLYSILTKYELSRKADNIMLYAMSTSPYLSRAIPFVTTHQFINKNLRQAIAITHETNISKDYSLTIDDLNNLDELIEDEIEYDWELEALEEEEGNT